VENSLSADLQLFTAILRRNLNCFAARPLNICPRAQRIGRTGLAQNTRQNAAVVEEAADSHLLEEQGRQ